MFTHQPNNGPGHMVYYGDISWELNLSDDKEQATLKIENKMILGKNYTIVNWANNAASVPAIIRLSIDGKNNMKI